MWYRDGTISVTASSNTVTGSGTSWVQSARVGDALQGPDGRLYEITNIASNTALSITPAYLGSTVSEAPYWIIPVQGYVKRSADRLAAITDEIHDLPGRVTSNEDSIANAEQAMLTKEGNLSELSNKAQSQLGLGVIETLAGVVFNTDNCTVVQNSNGVSLRFPSGLQLSIVPNEGARAITTAMGSLWVQNSATMIFFPQPFIVPPYAVGSVVRADSSEFRTYVALGETSITGLTFRVISPSSSSQLGGRVVVLAIGFWKDPSSSNNAATDHFHLP